jgi:hypothetical protein
MYQELSNVYESTGCEKDMALPAFVSKVCVMDANHFLPEK